MFNIIQIHAVPDISWTTVPLIKLLHDAAVACSIYNYTMDRHTGNNLLRHCANSASKQAYPFINFNTSTL